jgi:hypothetical protein
MKKTNRFSILVVLFLIVGCGSTPAPLKKSEAESVRIKTKKKNSELTQSEPQRTESPKVEIRQVKDLREFISVYQKTLQALGKKKEDNVFIVDNEVIEGMKQQLGRILQLDPSAITFLTNPRTDEAWFGNCALILDKNQEHVIILGKGGEEQILNLRDKIFGGLFRTEQGEWVFLSGFYGDLQRKVLYRVFWGATELKVVSFNFDRTKEGTVEGKAKSPTGGLLNIFRKGRDNKSVLVNGQILDPVFE